MRYILIDRITLIEPPERACGVKCVSLSEDYFTDHFRNFPVMPGTLILESLAQLGGVLVEATARESGRVDLHAVLCIVERASFRRFVRPGDRLDLEALRLAGGEDGGRVRVSARVDGALVTETEMTFALVPVEDRGTLAARAELLRVWLADHRAKE